MAKLNTNTVLPVGVLAGSASQLGQINVPKLGGMLIAVPAPGSIGPAGPASTVPGPQGPPGPMGPAGVDAAGALTAPALGSLVHSADPVTTVVDADEFAVADSADSFKAKRFSWSSLKAAILAWFGPVTAALSNKDLSAASNVFPSSLVTLTGAQSLSNKTLTSPRVDNLFDTAGKPLLGGAPVASAANWLIVSNAAAGAAPSLKSGGADGNVNLDLDSKGTAGIVTLNGVEAVSVSKAQTLTNKTISGATNTLSNIAVSSLAATGTADATTYLRGDGKWQPITGGGLSMTDNGDGTWTVT